MINYGKVRSTIAPQPIEITQNAVFLATNVIEYEETIDEQVLHEYEYDYVKYTKDEYLLLLAQKNKELSDELEATKIVLGVE